MRPTGRLRVFSVFDQCSSCADQTPKNQLVGDHHMAPNRDASSTRQRSPSTDGTFVVARAERPQADRIFT